MPYALLILAPLQVLDDHEIPKEISTMFTSISADTFRMDISSTELRKNQGGVIS
jgi:hypothetical protein